MVINFTPINKRPCVIRIKGRFFNYSLINIRAPTNDSEEEAKDQLYEQLERAHAACPIQDVKQHKAAWNVGTIRDVGQIHHSQELDPLSLALRQWDVGADQKGGEPIARIWDEGSPNNMRPENGVCRRRYNHKLNKEFYSSNAFNVTKTSRLRYALTLFISVSWE
jgi:hypothetical protein